MDGIAVRGENLVNGFTASDMTDTTPQVVIAAASNVNQSLWITDLSVGNLHATQGDLVLFTEGNAGPVKFFLAAGPNGLGGSISLKSPIRLAKNKGLYAVCLTGGALVRAGASGYSGM